MKKRFIGLLFSFLGLITASFAAHDFCVDRSQIDQEFAELSRLEEIVLDHNYCTLSELMKGNYTYSGDLNLNAIMISPFEPPLGIPSFFWGCCLGPIGIALAYVFSDEDKSEAKKALTGCLVGYGSYAILYIVVYVWILSNPAFYY